jgi:tetratricopeptide (TPR) repeat protein
MPDGSRARVRALLEELAARLDATADEVRARIDRLDAEERERLAERRYEPEGLAALKAELAALAAPPRDGARPRPHAAARRWLEELFTAIRASEREAAAAIAAFPSVGGELAAGADLVRGLITRLRADEAAGLELAERLAAGELDGWDRVLDAATRARAHRLAALFSIRARHDVERARGHVAEAVRLEPQNGVNHAERAFVALYAGDLAAAAADAHEAIELTPGDAGGHLALGLWAELGSEHADAEAAYVRGLDRLTVYAIGHVARRASVVEPSGLLLILAAERLLEAGRPERALELAAAALTAGVRGRTAYPDVRVYRLRHRALERLGRTVEAGAAASEAGKRHLWNEEPAAAGEELEAAVDLAPDLAEPWWLLAEARLRLARDGAGYASAMETWDTARRRFGPPAGDDSWAYVTRALVLIQLATEANDRVAAHWAALLELERALVHSPWDGSTLGVAAGYLRALGLQELAFEAAERGHELAPADRTVLNERMALLANRGRFAEASAAGRDLVAVYGDDPWVYGVLAWLALHEGRYEEALGYVALPLTTGYDLTWYLEVSALSRLSLGDVEAARADYRQALDLLADGQVVETRGEIGFTICVAYLVVGRLEEARRWSETVSARTFSATDDVSLPAARALVAFARDDVDGGVRQLRCAMAMTAGSRDVIDLQRHFPLRLQVLPGDADDARRRQEAATAVLDAEAPLRLAALATEEPPTAEAELQRVRQDGAGEPAAILTLAALDARRRADRGDLDGAAEAYEALRGTAFEPEATAGLRRILQARSEAALAAADVDGVRRSQARLAELGAVDPTAALLTVVQALRAAGDDEGARRELEAAETRDDLVEQALGDLALTAGDAVAAEAHYARALELTTDPGRQAQLETRAALAELSAGHAVKAASHVSAAVRRWREAGAFDAITAAAREAQAAVRDARHSPRVQAAVDALARLVAGAS